MSDLENIVMELVVSGGNARACAIEALRAAKTGDFHKAAGLINECNEALEGAHKVQTEVLQSEARGGRMEVSLLMVHAQDHLMNAITVKDLVVEMIDILKAKGE